MATLARPFPKLGSTISTTKIRFVVQMGSARRYFSAGAIQPVDLRHAVYTQPNLSQTEGPLVILHGFLGQIRNWQSLSKALSSELNRTVYALDLRNHGHSPQAAPHTYSAMAKDVLHFFEKHQLRDVQLIGHSMGGKVAMSAALADDARASAIEKLVVVDIAPSVGKMSGEFETYITAMKEVNNAGVKSRKEALEILKKVEEDPDVLAFLLTNLHVSGGRASFGLPLDTFVEFIPEIGSFPYQPGERAWNGPTLFIRGTNSNYINKRNIASCEQFFPRMKMEALPTGHWVHAERPHEFKRLLHEFLGKKAQD